MEGWLLDDNNEVQRVWMDKDVVNMKAEGDLEPKVEKITVKNRTYEVQVYSQAVKLGLTVRGHRLEQLGQLHQLLT